MNLIANHTAAQLTTALTEQPTLVLSFYSYGVLLRKVEGERVSEYPVDPAHIATALAAKVTLDTGLLTGNTLFVRQDGVKKTVIEYRPPQKTGLFLDGSETALRVPLPGLLLIRSLSDSATPQYAVFAVKDRPTKLDYPLFHAPLPNVFSAGAICWGTVPRLPDSALGSVSLAEDWKLLLGSSFGDHAVQGKSKAYPKDIRQRLIDLEARRVRRYPKRDLIPIQKTLAQVLESL